MSSDVIGRFFILQLRFRRCASRENGGQWESIAYTHSPDDDAKYNPQALDCSLYIQLLNLHAGSPEYESLPSQYLHF